MTRKKTNVMATRKECRRTSRRICRSSKPLQERVADPQENRRNICCNRTAQMPAKRTSLRRSTATINHGPSEPMVVGSVPQVVPVAPMPRRHSMSETINNPLILVAPEPRFIPNNQSMSHVPMQQFPLNNQIFTVVPTPRCLQKIQTIPLVSVPKCLQNYKNITVVPIPKHPRKNQSLTVRPTPRCQMTRRDYTTSFQRSFAHFLAQPMSLALSPRTFQEETRDEHHNEWPGDLEELVSDWDNQGHLWEVINWLKSPSHLPLPQIVANIREVMDKWDETFDNKCDQILEWLGYKEKSTSQEQPPKVVVEAQENSGPCYNQWSSMNEHSFSQ